jgi:hypothetical protein
MLFPRRKNNNANFCNVVKLEEVEEEYRRRESSVIRMDPTQEPLLAQT